MRQRRGFTLVDLLAVRNRERPAFTIIELLVLLVLIAIVTIAGCHIVAGPRAAAKRAVCMANLRTTGMAFTDYATANAGKFARVHTEGDPLAAPTEDNDLKSISTNAMNQVWMLIDEGYLPSMAFKCPADKRHTGPRGKLALRYGWANPSEFSYGIQYPFDHDPAGTAVNPACPAAAGYSSDWILMADRNPGKRVAGNKDWPNHPDGCSYLKMDGSVAFHEDSNSVILGQEIYGDDNAADGDVFPDSAGDVVILPDAPAD